MDHGRVCSADARPLSNERIDSGTDPNPANHRRTSTVLRILTRYVLRQLLAPFLFAAILLTALLMLDVVADRFGSLVGKGLGWRIVSEVFLYSIPFIFAVIVPMAVLVAVLFVFNRLAADNEISAMMASGISLARITLPVIVLATLLAIGLVHFNNTTLPESNHKLAMLLHSIGRKSPTFAVREREVNEVVDGVFLRVLDGGLCEHRRNLVPDLVGILIRVDPSPMQISVIVGGKVGDIDAGIAVGYVGHVSDPRV